MYLSTNIPVSSGVIPFKLLSVGEIYKYIYSCFYTAGEAQSNDAGKSGRYLAGVGSWLEEPESARLKEQLHLDMKTNSDRTKVIQENSGRTMLDSLPLQRQPGDTCVPACMWISWLHAVWLVAGNERLVC